MLVRATFSMRTPAVATPAKASRRNSGSSRPGHQAWTLRLVGKLLPVKAFVKAAFGEELAVGALLDDPAGVDDEDAVGIEDGRQAVGNDDDRPPLHQAIELELHLALGFAVEDRGRLV